MKWFFLSSLFLFLSCPGLIQAPPAKPGSGIPISSAGYSPVIPLDPNNPLYNLNDPNNPNNPNNPNDSNNSDDPDTQNLPITLTSDRNWGLVWCDEQSWSTENFNEQIRSFLSTSYNPKDMKWWIKCNFNDERFKIWKGGVFIRGRVSFQTGRFNPNSPTQNLSPSLGSSLQIHILDSKGNEVIKPITMNINPLSSSLTGNNIILVFKDEKGEVTLNGTANENKKIKDFTISGNMEFINYIDHLGQSRRFGGFLGYFEIPACSLLDCDRRSTASPESL